MRDPVIELKDYQIEITPLVSEKFKARVDIKLPKKDMGVILSDLEQLFAYCVDKYGHTIFCADLSLLTENLQAEYLQHLVHVNEIARTYFVSEADAGHRGGNYTLCYGFAPYMETVINVALAVLPQHNIRLIQASEVDSQVEQLSQ